MATLYIRKVPKDLHAAIRKKAKQNFRTISAEVLISLRHHFPTAKEIRARHDWYKKLQKIHKRKVKDDMPDSVQLIREDRER
jgi:plasmid stability protein